MHHVVVNGEGQYSAWPAARELPSGWKATGFEGEKEDCLNHIEEVWTDMTPASVLEFVESATNRLTTARLALRELTPEQVAVLLDPDATSDDWVTGYPLPGSKNAATGFGRRGPDDIRRGFGMYHLVRASDSMVIGEMGFHQPPAEGTVEVGFGLAETARGAGYAAEALAELVRWAFSQSGLDQVVARTMDSNLAAQNVLKRVGFRYVSPDGDFDRFVLGAADLAPVSEPFELNEAGLATVAHVTHERLPGGLPHELTFVPGTDPLLRSISQDGVTLAFAQCGALEGVDDKDNHYLHIVVRPEAARRGLGARLLSEARVFGRTEGKTGLVAATADEDEISSAWMRKHGFEVIGLHTVGERTPGATVAPAAAHLSVDQIDRADSGSVEGLMDLAMVTFAEAELPGGVKLKPDAETVRQLLLPDGDGLLLLCRHDERPVGWLAMEPAHDGSATLLGAQTLADSADTGVPAALMRAMALWADREQLKVTAFVEGKSQPELAAALGTSGFDRTGGRSIWRLAVESSPAQTDPSPLAPRLGRSVRETAL